MNAWDRTGRARCTMKKRAGGGTDGRSNGGNDNGTVVVDKYTFISCDFHTQ